jgi:hypothetical protein
VTDLETLCNNCAVILLCLAKQQQNFHADIFSSAFSDDTKSTAAAVCCEIWKPVGSYFLNIYNIVVIYCKRTEYAKLGGSYFNLTLSLLMSYIYGAPCKARNFNVAYM